MRPDAIPSVFPDLPEFILKMVKKRRKILPQDLEKKNNSEGTNDKEDKIETDKLNNIQENTIKEEEPVRNESVVLEDTNNIINNEIEIKSENGDSVEKEQDPLEENIKR